MIVYNLTLEGKGLVEIVSDTARLSVNPIRDSPAMYERVYLHI